MLETFTRLTLPIPAASSALSNAFSGVNPSACPTATATLVTFLQSILSLLFSRRGARPPSEPPPELAQAKPALPKTKNPPRPRLLVLSTRSFFLSPTPHGEFERL